MKKTILFFLFCVGSSSADEPTWIKYKSNRVVLSDRIGNVLADIESHIHTNHRYRYPNNLLTWTHETTHGINANIRDTHKDAYKVNGFYVLKDRALVIYEPRLTIRDVSREVPHSLRGPGYDLYLIQQQGGWNDRPLYLFDEWIAYTNGSECGKELNHTGWWFELLQSVNFSVYCTCVVKLEGGKDPLLKDFTKWNIERVISLCGKEVNGEGSDKNPTGAAWEYIRKVRTSEDSEEFRKSSRSLFGEDWCKKVWGF